MIVDVAEILFWLSLGLLTATWLLYPAMLCVLCQFRREPPARLQVTRRRQMTVLVAAHNEERNIDARIANIIDHPPSDFDLEVLIASDGSSDATFAIAHAWVARDPRVSAFQTSGARGKVAAHNQGVVAARGEIVVFTDAETEFDPQFLDTIGHAFDNPSVGFATGEIVWRNRSGELTGENFSHYWRYEKWLRRMETKLGIHALGSGACSAVLRHLYRPVPSSADQDFITPLDAILQGYRTIYVPEARAYDFVSETVMGEFKARIRMTAKNFANTFAHWGAQSLLWRPAVSLGLIFHKLFRWLTPYFALLVLFCGTLVLIHEQGTVPIQLVVTTGIAALLYGSVGAVCPKLPLAGSLWSFMVANAAFAIGVFRALTGGVPTAFR